MKTAFVTGGSGFVGRNLIPLLLEKGYVVKALARSEKSAGQIRQLGAISVQGDLQDLQALQTGMTGCTVVFHLAASINMWASEQELWADHVTGTENVLQAAKQAQVNRCIYLSTAMVVLNGKPIVDADERLQSDNLVDGYSRTKLAAEQRFLQANSETMQTVVIRPPIIWGKGDTSTLPQFVEAAQKGQLMFIGGGNHLFVTSHIRNLCHALLLAGESTVGGEVFFVTDGEKLQFKRFVKDYLATQGITVPDRSVPLPIAKGTAELLAWFWRTFKRPGAPPFYPSMIHTVGLPYTLSDAKIRRQLGFQNVVTVEEGLREMSEYR
ncbi:NAD-dependent epimerase/dehydratase family protein [Nibrella saemangeumensis]|uniref:NAD-dependent epimerase/dehydratase family protein n=1 Tax=Nibrella saemangeumensis TaxID=1084526 RepID=A0ABP8NTK8_9BACT